MIDPLVRAAMVEIVEHLVAGDYARLEELTQGRRLDRGAIASAVAEYGRTLVSPPEDAFDHLDVVKSERPCWSVRMHLWTLEECESDLTLEATVAKNGPRVILEIDDLHVL